MKKTMLTLFASIVLLAALSSIAAAKKQPTTDVAVAAITQMENDSVKADLAGDSSFVQKNYADNWTGGFSGGIWTTKESVLADMKDTANNKWNSQQISDLKVRLYGSTAIATYTDSYDAMVRGEHRVKTVLSTDTFVLQNGAWKEVASHSSVSSQIVLGSLSLCLTPRNGLALATRKESRRPMIPAPRSFQANTNTAILRSSGENTWCLRHNPTLRNTDSSSLLPFRCDNR